MESASDSVDLEQTSTDMGPPTQTETKAKRGRDFPSFVGRLLFRNVTNRKGFEFCLEAFVAEVVGTAWLMYFGCMGLFADAVVIKALSPMVGAWCFGMTVACIIVVTGHISMAHLNPAITVAFYILDTISPLTAILYIISETIGAILGMLLLKASVPPDLYAGYNSTSTCGFCGTCPSLGLQIWQAALLEFMATSFLCAFLCGILDPKNEKDTDGRALKFFLIISLLSMVVGPFTGASMNPARSLAPAIVNKAWNHHWIYWASPMSASVFTTYFYKFIFQTKPGD